MNKATCWISLLILVFTQSVSAKTEVAGEVIFSTGISRAFDEAGISRVIEKGDSVNSGDLLQTGSGHLQIRLSDDGFVSLKPRSKLLIKKYQYNKDKDVKRNAIFELFKGSVRAITGLIGTRDKKAFKYRTPVATIGIRGTAFVLNYCDNDCFDDKGVAIANGLYVNNGEGKIYVTSEGGTIDLARGQFAYVADIASQPQQLRQTPNIVDLLPDSIEQFDFDFRASEITSPGNNNEAITPVVLTNDKAFFSNTGVDISSLDVVSNSHTTTDINNDTSKDSSGNLASFLISGVEFNPAQLNNGSTPTLAVTVQNTGSAASDGITQDIVWGIWQSNSGQDGQEYLYQNNGSNIYDNSDTASGGGTGPMQFVYSDNITPDSVIQGLLGSSTSITYGNPIGGSVSIATSAGSSDFMESTGVFVQASASPANITIDFGVGMITDFRLAYTVDNNLTTSFSVDASGSEIGSADISDGLIATDQIFCSSLYCGGTGNSIGVGQVTADIQFSFVGSDNPDAVIGTVTVDRSSDVATGTPSASIATTFAVGQ